MLLQMTFEKLGKAAFTRRTPLTAGHAEPPHNHRTASTLLDLLRRSPGAAPIAPSPAVYAAVVELENAHPDVAKPNANLLPPKLLKRVKYGASQGSASSIQSGSAEAPADGRQA